MRIIFMGSPDFAVPSLDALVDAGHDVVAAYASRRGRRGAARRERKTAVHERAEQLGIEVRTPGTLATTRSRRGFGRSTPISRSLRPTG